MIYNGANELDCKRAKERLNYLIDKRKLFKIVQKREQRSLKQNQYLHLILSWFAHEYGETVQYVKHHFFKITVNPDLFLTQHVNNIIAYQGRGFDRVISGPNTAAQLAAVLIEPV